jgi:acetolactate synthase-1/2/3 large subunit
VLPPDAVLTTDAGNFGLWPARGFSFNQPGTFLGPTSGAMGYGLPAAIAASLCLPRRAVVALCGDGGMAMLMAELETAVREGARPVALVFDNRRFGTIAMHQEREGRTDLATELGPIDFAAVARACGAQGGRVSRDSEFEPALRDALAAGGPALLQLEVDPRWVTPDDTPAG